MPNRLRDFQSGCILLEQSVKRVKQSGRGRLLGYNVRGQELVVNGDLPSGKLT